MNEALNKKQPIMIGKSSLTIDSSIHNQQTHGKKTRSSRPSQFEEFLEKKSVIFALEILIVVLFIVFVFKLCCNKNGRDPRIIRGKGSGSNVGGGGTKKIMNISGKKTNHRRGMKVPKVIDISESSSSSQNQDI